MTLRLFCLPYAGGRASVFQEWSAHVPAGIELVPIELPGRGRRIDEPLVRQIDRLLPLLAAPLRPLLEQPFALFGHSMGALVAFALAHYLRREYGASLAVLIVAAHRAPQLVDGTTAIHSLPDGDLIRWLIALQGVPQVVLEEPELMQIVLPVIRADFAVCESYVHEPLAPLPCPIVACGGQDDPMVSRFELTAWREQTIATFQLHMFPGSHFFLHTSRAEVLETLAGILLPAAPRVDRRRGEAFPAAVPSDGC